MSLQNLSRRRLLVGGVAAVTGTAGCSGSARTEADGTTEPSPESVDSPSPTGTPAARLAELTVAEFILYPLSGTHPHVHRKAGRQYVVVRLSTELDRGAATEAVALELDGEAVGLASRQPVPWRKDTVDVAFAVAKDRTVGSGELQSRGSTLRTLSAETISRLNEPPEFDVGEPSVSPAEIGAVETEQATVSFTVANRGDGAGTFGASLSENYVSGSKLVTASLQPGEERELTPSIRIRGEGDVAHVRLDWGVDQWVTEIPVAGTETA
ncbi:hypothetical protein [Halolamina salifodinae]|uniref:CARDB domain-containing protein n=1 Tax=Halolamina salifodinae TaxID=1202767 RepID=A0A8T4GST3_9EURY|nr:hypothetical protein [Halolamina salifodinae]MBP1985916.1 hypothetical protein [Halolamina salifodinae]